MKVMFASMALVAGISIVTLSATAADTNTNSTGKASASASQVSMPPYLDAKSLMDVTVKNPQGDDIGKIHNVLFNPEKSEFFATIDVGSSRYALVPWKALTISSTSNSGSSSSGGLFGSSSSSKLHVTMNTTKEALKSAPTLSEKQESNLNNPTFLQTVYQHYKLEPPSAMGGSNESSSSGQSTGSSTDTNNASGSGSSNSPSADSSQPESK